jgi:hypothetical protein
MDLDEFIKETLVQIARGVTMANAELEPERVKENGKTLPKLFLLQPGGGRQEAGVAFDIAVTTHKDTSAKGGSKVRLAVFEADLSGKGGITKTDVSKIQFSININQWHG